MKIISSPRKGRPFRDNDRARIRLYRRDGDHGVATTGAAILESLRRKRMRPIPRALDLLSIALSVTAADKCVTRSSSPDGWTRVIDLDIAVVDPNFWNSQSALLDNQLRLLTTDLWRLSFNSKAQPPLTRYKAEYSKSDCVTLLSGGLDSFIGIIDLVGQGRHPYAVSQIVRGDAEKQAHFAKVVGDLEHLQLNHATTCWNDIELSERARSFLFLTYGVLVATSLERYKSGAPVPLYVSENGFISINAPLTPMRIGSLSTRTTHPGFIAMFQSLLDSSGIGVRLINPYQTATKGEMLLGCKDQTLLKNMAHTTTSCGKFKRHGYIHCGRCLPCLVRRAAFLKWGAPDKTKYKFADLSKDSAAYKRYDDVMSVAMAAQSAREDGIQTLLGSSLASVPANTVPGLESVAQRGLDELSALLKNLRAI